MHGKFWRPQMCLGLIPGGNLSQRLTVSLVDTFIADLKDAVRDAKLKPSGKGTMVAVYGVSSILALCSRQANCLQV